MGRKLVLVTFVTFTVNKTDHSQNIQKLILLWLTHRWKIKASYCYEESFPIIIDDRLVSKHYYFWWTIHYIISDYEKSSPYSHLPVCNDIQCTSNNVIRSLPSIVDKIDLSVINLKQNLTITWNKSQFFGIAALKCLNHNNYNKNYDGSSLASVLQNHVVNWRLESLRAPPHSTYAHSLSPSHLKVR